MNNAEVLCHSSGPWKKHKYFQKIGEGANAVYRYSKKAIGDAAKAAGSEERAEWKKKKKIADRYDEDLKEHGYDPLDRNSGRDDTFDKYVNLNDPHDKAIKDWTNWQNNSDRWKEQGRKLATKSYNANAKEREARSNYYKTPMGKVELSSAGQAATKAASIAKEKVSRGQKLIDKLFHPETKITITSNLMPAGTKKTYYKK